MNRTELIEGKARTGNNELNIALVGNPNAGKTTLFNALTGLKQKVGNYPGVTVEKKVGGFEFSGQRYHVHDLPGTYSLKAASEDERIVRDILLKLIEGDTEIDLVVVVIDASHLERHLYLATQVMDLGLPMVIALTMNDEAAKVSKAVDPIELARRLDVPVVEVTVPRRLGIEELKQAVHAQRALAVKAPAWSIGEGVLAAVDELAAVIGRTRPNGQGYLREAALEVLLDADGEHPLLKDQDTARTAERLRDDLEGGGVQWQQAEALGRYAWIKEITKGVLATDQAYRPNIHDRVDTVLTHPFWGIVVFAIVMALVFQSIFSWSAPFMDWIDGIFGLLGELIAASLPPGPLQGLLSEGVIAGVGGVVIFLPQIVILFLFIAVLEDTGYMARAAYIMNRHMRRAGLHGRAFIPLLSGFACSIPGIMAARAIADKNDRLTTIMVVPLISCSARLPVYTLVIAAFIPATRILPGFTYQGLTLLSAYVISIIAAITAAFILRKTTFKGETQPFILELPPYRLPDWKTVLMSVWTKAMQFVVNAGTIILAVTILLWFLLSFPENPRLDTDYDGLRAQAMATMSGDGLEAELARIGNMESGDRLKASYAGRIGRAIEPALRPLGFDWKIGIGLIGSVAAREVFVSTMAVVYGVGETEADDEGLIATIQNEVDPHTGRRVYNIIVAINILLFFILACQCIATVAVVKRETNTWKWPLFMVAYMTVTAYVVCLIFYQVAIRIWPQLPGAG